MKTITNYVHDLIKHQPFLEDALYRDIINFSSLAKELQPKIEQMMRKPVKEGSIVMALRRYLPRNLEMNSSFKGFGDIVFRSNITDYTFVNSNTLVQNQAKLLTDIKDNYGAYFTYASNYQESSIIVSSTLKPVVEEYFKDETCICIKDDLSSLSIELPKKSSDIIGLYFYLFKLLAYEGIPVFEIISTSNYFTIFLEKEYANKAFILMNEIKSF
ncbi:ACT domain-containing protein [Aureivirga marina]|uniref:hypothetical protein n=1 Tax=Aureivirga marina TaxID=1182451 RepID=UPI0018C9BDEB|nr:hypothetical protein [Aureivirga marina]